MYQIYTDKDACCSKVLRKAADLSNRFSKVFQHGRQGDRWKYRRRLADIRFVMQRPSPWRGTGIAPLSRGRGGHFVKGGTRGRRVQQGPITKREMRGNMCAREQRMTELQLELDRLREQSCRQSAALSSTRQRLQDAEARERALQVRSEMAQQTLQRELRQLEDRVRCLEKRNRCLENQLTEEERCRDCTKLQNDDFMRRLAMALDIDERCDTATPDALLQKAGDVVQELSRLKCKYNSTADALATCEADARAMRDGLQRAAAEREGLVRQNGCREIEATRLRESLDAKIHELQASKERLNNSEAHAETLRTDLQTVEERLSRLQVEHQSLLQCIWQGLGGRGEWKECAIKDRIREIMTQNQELSMQAESCREKLSMEHSRACDLQENAACRERAHEAKVIQLQGEIDLLRREHVTLHSYLQRLSISLAYAAPPRVEENAPCLSEQLLQRAEHLVRVEAEKHCCDKTTVVNNLQKRIRILKDQLQRKELHVDLLKKKLQLQEENHRSRCLLQWHVVLVYLFFSWNERDEAIARAKRSARNAEKAAAQLADANNQIRCLNQQLSEAADMKICLLERSRKVEELQQRLSECENQKIKQARQHSATKEHSRQNEQCLREEAQRLRASLSDNSHALSLLQSFRGSVARLLAIPSSHTDSEIICRLQKMVTAKDVHHHDPDS
ncbi:coiled-coil domain-containing protein 170-like [Ctenocephalides felis]|uniref:coiled-coil domain-containing protein 170-like n=1 Tax=Ctenocephalides felis TaxID=7515 RepID=UPI000E6E1E1E|nr:coiled-coil domain-containing protein 170-like [Ctenocephalides felis]